MRRISFSFLLIHLFINSPSQIIKGTIKDKYSDGIINYASIYFSGTFVGVNSDQNGSFELDVSKYASMPLTISALGYYSATVTKFSSDTVLQIYLIPKVFKLNEVVITAKANTKLRKANLEVFRNEFLGTTLNAMSCKIINEKDITLVMDNGTLKAFASKPIQIINKALGYEITYYLDKFEYSDKTKSLLFFGNIIFREEPELRKNRKKKVDDRRAIAYFGSRMHFFRELWNHNLESSGFAIRESTNSNIDYDKLLISTDSVINGTYKKYLKYSGNLYISFYTKASNSILIMNKEYVNFDKNGYYEPIGISWYGEMAKQRIADLLPYEY